MTTKIQKWCNSQGVRIAKHRLTNVGVDIGDEVELSVEEGQIIVRKVRHKKFDLKELVAQMPRLYKAREEDWESRLERMNGRWLVIFLKKVISFRSLLIRNQNMSKKIAVRLWLSAIIFLTNIQGLLLSVP